MHRERNFTKYSRKKGDDYAGVGAFARGGRHARCPHPDFAGYRVLYLEQGTASFYENGGDANQDTQQDSAQHNVGTTAPGLFGGFGWQAGVSNATPAARMAQLQQKLQSLNTQQAASTGIQGGYFTVQVPAGGCPQAVDVAPVNPGPLGLDQVAHHGTYTYPRGLLRFELPQCAAATVDVLFNAATFGAGWSWRFYGPSIPGNNTTMGWYDVTTLVTSQLGNDWQFKLTSGGFGSYRPAGTNSILFEGGPAYNDTVFSDNFQ